MKEILLPYHRGSLTLPRPANLQAVLVSKAHQYAPRHSQQELVEQALDKPIHSARLEELVRGKKSMVIITSDHTRPVPSHITLPILLQRIRSANPGVAITILVSTGTHRASTHAEMVQKYGAEIVRREKIVVHDSRNKEQLAPLGALPTGLHAEVNKLILETDFLMAEGFIEPHFFAGFSGGRKSVFPGVASLAGVKANHCAQHIASPYARTGVLEHNPVHLEALEVAKMAGLQFILNVALDAEKNIIAAFAGHFNAAHLAGCEFVGGLCRVFAAPADIVITTNGGYPLDQNIYQAVKGMTAAEACCKEGGVIIAVAACSDGHGGEGFYQTFKNAASPAAVTQQIMARSRAQTIEDQWESQILARILEQHRVIMVAFPECKGIIEDMFMEYAADVEEALRLAYTHVGAEASVTVIPDGIAVVVTAEGGANT